MSVTAAQLVAEVKSQGDDQAKNNLAGVGKAVDTLGQKLSAMKPVDTSRVISNVDEARAKLTLIESDVTKAREKLETLQNAANAGQAVTGIPEAEAKLTLLESKAQSARATLQKMEEQEQKTATAMGQISQAAWEASQEVSGSDQRMSEQTNIFTSVVAKARELAQSAFSRIGEAAQQIFTSVGDAAQSAFARVGEDAQQAFSQVEESSIQATDAIGKTSSQGLLGSLTNLGGGLIGAVSQAGFFIQGLQMVGQTALNAAKFLLEPNASLEQTRVSFQAFIPDAKLLTNTLAGLRQFAAVTPFESDQVNQAALSLLNMNVKAQDLTKWIGNLGAAVSKVGGGGQVLDDVTAIIGQMGVKGKITTEEMLQLSERNIPAFQILADAMGVPVATLQQMISNGELGRDKIDLLVQAMGKFGGSAMVEQGKTFNGLLSTIADNAKMALATFTGPLFDLAKSGLQKLGDLVSAPAFQDFAKLLGEKVGAAISGFIGWLTSLYNAIAPVITVIGSWIQQHHILDIAMKVLQARIQFALLPITVLRNVIMFLIGKFQEWEARYHLVEQATTVVTAVVTKLHDIIEKLRQKVQDVITYVQNWVGSFHLAQHAGEALQFVISRLHDFITKLSDKIGQVAARFQDWEQKHHLVQRASEALHTVTQKLQDIAEKLRAKIKEVADRFQDWLNRHQLVHQAADALHTILSKLHDLIQRLKSRVEEIITRFHNWEESHHIVQRASEILHQILGKLHDLIHLVEDRVRDAIGAFHQWWSEHHALQTAADLLRGGLDRLHTIIVNVKERIKEAIAQFRAWHQEHGILQTAAEGLRSSIQRVHDFIKNLVDRAKDIIAHFQQWNEKAQPLTTTLANLQTIGAKLAYGLSIVGQAVGAVLAPLGQIWQVMVADLMPAWKEFQQALDPLKKSFADLMVTLSPIAKIIGGVLLAAIVAFVGVVVSIVAGLATGIAAAAGGVIRVLTGIATFFTGIFTFLGGVVKLAVDLVTGHFDRLSADMGQISHGILLMIQGVWTAITGAIQIAVGFIVGLVMGFVNGIITFFKFLYDKLIGHSIVVDLANGLRMWFQKAYDWITGIFRNIGQWFADRFNSIKTYFASLPENLRKTAQNMWNAITGFFSSINPGQWFTDNVWDPIKNAASVPFNSVSGIVAGAFNGVIDVINGVIDNVNKINVAGFGVHIDRIPHLAKGTSFFAGGPALLGDGNEPEVVLGPTVGYLPRGARVVPMHEWAGGGTTTQTIVVQPAALYIDGRQVTTMLMPHVANQIRIVTGQK